MKREPNWKDCIENETALKITPDKLKAISLIETSKDRIKYMAKELNENTCNFIFEDYYTSLLELIEAISLLDGYKISNHLCFGFYIKDVLNKVNLFYIFDDLRFKRNSLVYYGKRMEIETAKNAIEKSKRLISELNSLIKVRL